MKPVIRAAILVFVLATTTIVDAQFPPAPGTGPGLPETVEAIDSARVTTRILYVTAHPDDESSAVLTYLARGLHANVALLSLTRGEGGQNALGPEQAPQLGLIRTQELLAATRGYGVKLFFTRAKDFGFSKTPEETEKIWGDQVLEDMVRVIRTFRPNIVINNWGGVHRGHGHHQAAGLLTPKAVQMAADNRAFPAQLQQGLIPWDGNGTPVQILDLDRFSEKPEGYILPVDDVSPLWGKTWRQIGMDAFVNHRTQGISAFVGSSFFRRPIALKREDGAPLDPATLARPLYLLAGGTSGARCKTTPVDCQLLREAEDRIMAAHSSALELDWKNASASLAAAAIDMNRIQNLGRQQGKWWHGTDPYLDDLLAARTRIERALVLAAGLEVSARANRSDVVLGDPFEVSTEARCRPEAGCKLGPVTLTWPEGMGEAEGGGEPGKFKATVKQNLPNRLVWEGSVSQATTEDAWLQIHPEVPPLLSMVQPVEIAGYSFSVSRPVIHVDATSTHAEEVPLRIVPAFTVEVEPRQAIEPLSQSHKPIDIFLRIHSYTTRPSELSAGVWGPWGWVSSPPVKLKVEGAGDQYAHVRVTPPQDLKQGDFDLRARALRGEEKFSTSIEALPSMPTLLWEEPAECVVHAFDVNVPQNLRVGYITAEHEPVPDDLRMLGIRVEMLDPETLAFGDLSKYDAIVVGVRAYEIRSDLPGANQRLLDYVSSGGTLVVQYQRDFAWDRFNYAPYPAKIDSNQPGDPLPRITDENSPVKFLRPDDVLLNKPNKITMDDFKGWVQERGLYFWSQFDAKYTPLLGMNDPGEKELDGGLVYTKYGKGTYIYTGIAFFRQLPEGVSGAYRLFVNLLSASRVH